jgi:hypothetical protein
LSALPVIGAYCDAVQLHSHARKYVLASARRPLMRD